METTYADWEINLDDIKIVSEIQSAGDTVVYLCLWRNYQTVVMKVIPGCAERELNILSKCLHPCICQFLGGCIQNDKTFMLFEYMPFGNLKTFMKSEPSRLEKLKIAFDVSIALDYLANRKPNGILHRDIKPENILIGVNKCAKLCDFGISKITLTTASPRRHTGEMGTVRWTAPEVLASQLYDEKSDVYSFGMVLKYIWSGVIPYSDYEMAFQAAFAKINNIKDDTSIIDDPSIRSLVERCISFDPSLRPTHSQVAESLKNLLLSQ